MVIYVITPLKAEGKGKRPVGTASRAQAVYSLHHEAGGRRTRLVDGTIVFTGTRLRELGKPHEVALVLSLEVGGCLTLRVLVDPGSGADIIQMPVIWLMGLSVEESLGPKQVLTEFNGAQT